MPELIFDHFFNTIHLVKMTNKIAADLPNCHKKVDGTSFEQG
jgi:hypothetical protein